MPFILRAANLLAPRLLSGAVGCDEFFADFWLLALHPYAGLLLLPQLQNHVLLRKVPTSHPTNSPHPPASSMTPPGQRQKARSFQVVWAKTCDLTFIL